MGSPLELRIGPKPTDRALDQPMLCCRRPDLVSCAPSPAKYPQTLLMLSSALIQSLLVTPVNACASGFLYATMCKPCLSVCAYVPVVYWVMVCRSTLQTAARGSPLLLLVDDWIVGKGLDNALHGLIDDRHMLLSCRL